MQTFPQPADVEAALSAVNLVVLAAVGLILRRTGRDIRGHMAQVTTLLRTMARDLARLAGTQDPAPNGIPGRKTADRT